VNRIPRFSSTKALSRLLAHEPFLFQKVGRPWTSSLRWVLRSCFSQAGLVVWLKSPTIRIARSVLVDRLRIHVASFFDSVSFWWHSTYTEKRRTFVSSRLMSSEHACEVDFGAQKVYGELSWTSIAARATPLSTEHAATIHPLAYASSLKTSYSSAISLTARIGVGSSAE